MVYANIALDSNKKFAFPTQAQWRGMEIIWKVPKCVDLFHYSGPFTN